MQTCSLSVKAMARFNFLLTSLLVGADVGADVGNAFVVIVVAAAPIVVDV